MAYDRNDIPLKSLTTTHYDRRRKDREWMGGTGEPELVDEFPLWHVITFLGCHIIKGTDRSEVERDVARASVSLSVVAHYGHHFLWAERGTSEVKWRKWDGMGPVHYVLRSHPPVSPPARPVFMDRIRDFW